VRIVELLDIVEGAALALLVWLRPNSMSRHARDMRVPFAAIFVQHKRLHSFELGTLTITTLRR
jgi:hypothetical protein